MTYPPPMNDLEKKLLAAIASGHPERRIDVQMHGKRMRVAPLTWNEISVAMGVPQHVLTDAIAHLVAAGSIESARQPAGFFKRLRGEEDTTFFFATDKGCRILQEDADAATPQGNKAAALTNVEKIVHHLGYTLTPHGVGVALLSLESGYNEFSTSTQMALVTLAMDIREAGDDITKLMAFVPHTMAMIDIMKEWKDKGVLPQEIFENDGRAMIKITTVSPDQKEWLDRVLSDPISAKERVANCRLDYMRG